MEILLRYFWLFVLFLHVPNYFILREPTLRRLVLGGAERAEAASAFNAVTVISAALPLPMFLLQHFSSTPDFPLLAFIPQLGGAALASFSLLAIWYASFLGTMWFNPKGPLFAAAACQGFISPSQARLVHTIAVLVLFPAVLAWFAVGV